MWHDVLYSVRIANIFVGGVAFFFVLRRLNESMEQFGARRVARYWGYLLSLFAGTEGSLESTFQDAPLGVKTVLTLAFLSFAAYSELPERKVKH